MAPWDEAKPPEAQSGKKSHLSLKISAICPPPALSKEGRHSMYFMTSQVAETCHWYVG